MTKQRLNTLWLILALLPVPLIWCVLFETGSLNRAREWVLDLRFKARGEIAAPAKIIYIDIDSKALDPAEIGGWPWSRSYLAKVCRALTEKAGVKAVGIDVVLSDTGLSESADVDKISEGNIEFARYLWNDPPVVLAAAFSGSAFRDETDHLKHRELPLLAKGIGPVVEIEAPELPQFRINGRPPYSPAGAGLIDTENGGTRRVPLFAPSNVRTYNHLAVELLRRYWGVEMDGVVVTDDTMKLVQTDGTVVATVPLIDGQLLEVNWFSPWISNLNPRVSFADVYGYAHLLESGVPEAVESAEAYFSLDDFKDAIVLIGPVDPLLQDLAPTPFDDAPVPKVGVHGNVLKTILAGRYLKRLSDPAVYGVVFGMSGLVVLLTVSGGRHSLRARLGAAGTLLGYVWLAFHLFSHFDWVLPVVAPIGSALSATFLAVSWQAVQEQKAKGRIKGMFGTYLSPMVVNSMIESGKDPELGGHDAEITAYFSDIQSFSAFSEVLSSAQLGELLNEYLTVCTDIIQAEGGTLDKYIGDAVVAMFGAPLDLEMHAYKACLVSQLIQTKLGELRHKWASEGEKWPKLVHEMRTRIGLNTGMCMIGNMGSRTRFNYTMMGDNVNLAARMESGAKSWGTFTMITESTKLACEKHGGDRIVFRPLGRIQVKGRSAAVPIYEVVGLREQVSAETFECIELFARGLERYYARDWVGAASLFEQSEKLEPFRPKRDAGVKSNPSMVYLHITAEMEDHPPSANWDGTYVMTEK